jgi:hypothetical protein
MFLIHLCVNIIDSLKQLNISNDFKELLSKDLYKATDLRFSIELKDILVYLISYEKIMALSDLGIFNSKSLMSFEALFVLMFFFYSLDNKALHLCPIDDLVILEINTIRLKHVSLSDYSFNDIYSYPDLFMYQKEMHISNFDDMTFSENILKAIERFHTYIDSLHDTTLYMYLRKLSFIYFSYEKICSKNKAFVMNSMFFLFNIFFKEASNKIKNSAYQFNTNMEKMLDTLVCFFIKFNTENKSNLSKFIDFIKFLVNYIYFGSAYIHFNILQMDFLKIFYLLQEIPIDVIALINVYFINHEFFQYFDTKDPLIMTKILELNLELHQMMYGNI